MRSLTKPERRLQFSVYQALMDGHPQQEILASVLAVVVIPENRSKFSVKRPNHRPRRLTPEQRLSRQREIRLRSYHNRKQLKKAAR